MLKKLSVIILSVIQLIFCVSLALYNPVIEWLVDKKGDVYHLKVDYIAYADDYDISGNIFYYYNTGWQGLNDAVSHDVLQGEYCIVETDENGISHLSEITEKKPENIAYLKGPFAVRLLMEQFDFPLNESMVKALNELGIYEFNNQYDLKEYSGGHDITVAVKAYKGYYSAEKELRIDGIPIEDYLNKIL